MVVGQNVFPVSEKIYSQRLQSLGGNHLVIVVFLSYPVYVYRPVFPVISFEIYITGVVKITIPCQETIQDMLSLHVVWNYSFLCLRITRELDLELLLSFSPIDFISFNGVWEEWNPFLRERLKITSGYCLIWLLNAIYRWPIVLPFCVRTTLPSFDW